MFIVHSGNFNTELKYTEPNTQSLNAQFLWCIFWDFDWTSKTMLCAGISNVLFKLVNIVRIYNIHKDAFVILCYFGVVYRRFGFVQMYLGHVWSILLASTQFALIQFFLSVNTP